jgi:hypothetical protein
VDSFPGRWVSRRMCDIWHLCCCLSSARQRTIKKRGTWECRECRLFAPANRRTVCYLLLVHPSFPWFLVECVHMWPLHTVNSFAGVLWSLLV